jgi:hypothetical protein
VGAGGKINLLHRVFKVAGDFRIELAVGLHLAWAHRRVGGVGGFPEAFGPDFPSGGDAGADGGRRFTASTVGGKLADVDGRNLDVEVDPVTKFAVFMSAASPTAIRVCPKNENSRGGVSSHEHGQFWPEKKFPQEETPTGENISMSAIKAGMARTAPPYHR